MSCEPWHPLDGNMIAADKHNNATSDEGLECPDCGEDMEEDDDGTFCPHCGYEE